MIGYYIHDTCCETDTYQTKLKMNRDAKIYGWAPTKDARDSRKI